MISKLTDSSGNAFTLHRTQPEGTELKPVQFLFLPGAHMGETRYGWIPRQLSKQGYAVTLLNPPILKRESPFREGAKVKSQMTSIDQLCHATQLLNKESDAPLIIIGHSWGGIVLLESFDAKKAQNIRMLEVPNNFDGHIENMQGVVVLGASLQAEALGRKIPGRSDTKPLNKPTHLPLLLISAEFDDMAPPTDIQRTTSRFRGGAVHKEIKGGNHLNWAEGKGWADRPDLDGQATIDPVTQQKETIDHILSFADQIEANLTSCMDIGEVADKPLSCAVGT